MGDVLKFEPAEASPETVEISNEIIDLIQEREKRSEEMKKLGEEISELATRLEEAEARLQMADHAREYGKIFTSEILPMQMEIAKKVAEKRRFGIEKLAIASDLENVRNSRWAGEIKMPVVAFSPEETKWLKKGEKLSKTMQTLADIKEEEIMIVEEEFFGRKAA